MPKANAILANNLKELLEVNIPQQFVSSVGLSIIEKFCQKLSLPAPSVLGGNVLIGDVKSCNSLLTAHLDELSFGFKRLESGGGWLAPYHKYSLRKETAELTIVGIRNQKVVEIGRGKLVSRNTAHHRY